MEKGGMEVIAELYVRLSSVKAHFRPELYLKTHYIRTPAHIPFFFPAQCCRSIPSCIFLGHRAPEQKGALGFLSHWVRIHAFAGIMLFVSLLLGVGFHLACAFFSSVRSYYPNYLR